MKKRLFLLAGILLTLISLTGCGDCKEYPYYIETRNYFYRVESYKIKDGCVTFKYYFDCDEKEYSVRTICGDFEIVKY